MPDSQDPPWSIKDHPRAAEYLGRAAQGILERLRTGSGEDRLAFLCDTRAVHRELFAPLTPEGYAAYAGSYRGEAGSVLEHRKAAIHYKNIEGLKERYPALNPAEVIPYMATLEDFIRETFLAAEGFDTDIYFTRMVRIFGMFSKIHPYLDGNGHISRTMMILLAERRGIEVSPTWTIHPRPYGIEMAIAFEHYKTCPVILKQVLKLWFKV